MESKLKPVMSNYFKVLNYIIDYRDGIEFFFSDDIQNMEELGKSKKYILQDLVVQLKDIADGYADMSNQNIITFAEIKETNWEEAAELIYNYCKNKS